VNPLLAARRTAGRVRRRLFPSREVAAWRAACRLAERTPRYREGTIELDGLAVRYTDLLTVCPQWHSLFVDGSYRFQASSPTPRILDCGANLGLASLYWKRLYPRARITAYEADPRIAAALRQNLAANGAADVEVVEAAVWNAEGRLAFHAEGADSGAIAALPGAPASGARVEVAAVRLRDALERGPVDLLKLDVEGAEEAILADCAGALGSVGAILAEIHELDPARRITPAILELLAREGFAVALDELVPLPWREPLAGPASPFPRRALAWVCLVRAFRR
jgi:FkbM family methyltransferase